MTVKGIIKELETFLLPQLNEIKGELKAINTRIDSLDTKIEELDKRLTAEIASVRREMETRFTALSEKLDIIKDVEQMKARLSQLEARH